MLYQSDIETLISWYLTDKANVRTLLDDPFILKILANINGIPNEIAISTFEEYVEAYDQYGVSKRCSKYNDPDICMMRAAKVGDNELVKLFYSQGAHDIMATIKIAARNNNIDLINIMIDFANDRFTTNVEWQLLYTEIIYGAAMFGNFELMTWAIAKKLIYLDENVKAYFMSKDYNRIMFYAAVKNHVEIIQYAVDNGGTNYNAIIKGAVNNNNIELLKWAIENGADVNIILYAASENGNYELLNFALKNGANKYDAIFVGAASGGFIDLMEKYNTYNERALLAAVELAARKNHFYIVKYLISSLDLNETQRKKMILQCLNSAASKNNLDIINWIETSYGCFEDCKYAILRGCCIGDNLSLFITIYNELVQIDADVGMEGILSDVIFYGSIKILRWILINIAYNYNFNMMLSRAIRTNSFPIMKLIKSHGSTVTIASVNACINSKRRSLQTFVWLLSQLNKVIPYMQIASLSASRGALSILQYCLEKLGPEQINSKEFYQNIYHQAVAANQNKIAQWALLYLK
jgi:hypothetical protein